jgi:cephalosporin hydroxylase
MTTRDGDAVREVERFAQQKREMIRDLGQDAGLKQLARQFLHDTGKFRYTYHFAWLGRPIIQLPQDLLALQEIVWAVRPDLIIETGIAHGGSLIFHASLLELLGADGRVLGIDIEIRSHNRAAIQQHPMASRIDMIEGSSIAPNVVDEVRRRAAGKRAVMVVLDSNHTHAHVLQELRCYGPLVSRDSYLVVMDTGIEDQPKSMFPDRPWGPGDNPRTAVWQYLSETDRFVIDKEIEHKLLITAAPDGYLKCVKD